MTTNTTTWRKDDGVMQRMLPKANRA